MATNTNIEWATHTFNPWWGCTKVHEGCKNCYAETLDRRYAKDGRAHWGPSAPRRMILGEWGKPEAWNAQAAKDGALATVFCASMSDIFEHYQGPVVDPIGAQVEIKPHRWRAKFGQFWTVEALRAWVMLDIIPRTPHLVWLLLTKRPQNVMAMVPAPWLTEEWPGNVWIGTSPCNQVTADKALPYMDTLASMGANCFLSCEPLLGPVDLKLRDRPGIGWVIVGGESGPGARPCNISHVRSIVAQCREAGRPCFVKQLGGNVIVEESVWRGDNRLGAGGEVLPGAGDNGRNIRVLDFLDKASPPGTVRLHIKAKKGQDPAEWPPDIRVQELPKWRGG